MMHPPLRLEEVEDLVCMVSNSEDYQNLKSTTVKLSKYEFLRLIETIVWLSAKLERRNLT